MTKTGNRRVDRLLATAEKYGLTIEPSPNVPDCYTIRGNSGHSITIYAQPNHGAHVMADLPGEKDWITITQRRAFSVIVNGTLKLEWHS